jgi:NADPH:quinone reductase-like Zn-dependent oxidoreductase
VLKELLETGKIVPVLDRCFPLSKVGEAMRYFGVEHARGKVIIAVDQAKEEG